MINTTNVNLVEILDKANKAKDPAAVLKQFVSNKALSYTLKWAFDTSIKSVLPVGTPPFKSTQDTEDQPSEGLVIQHLKQFSYWVESGNSKAVAPARREQMFIEMLSVVSKDEALMMCAVKDKELHKMFKNITPAIINNVFPGLLVSPLVIATPKKPAVKKKAKKKVTKTIVTPVVTEVETNDKDSKIQ